jgi:hypothetical protein
MAGDGASELCFGKQLEEWIIIIIKLPDQAIASTPSEEWIR